MYVATLLNTIKKQQAGIFHTANECFMNFFFFRFLETVLESTFNLFATSSDPELGSSELQYMTPLHFLALVDPRATWFKKWMVSLNNETNYLLIIDFVASGGCFHPLLHFSLTGDHLLLFLSSVLLTLHIYNFFTCPCLAVTDHNLLFIP